MEFIMTITECDNGMRVVIDKNGETDDLVCEFENKSLDLRQSEKARYFIGQILIEEIYEHMNEYLTNEVKLNIEIE